MSDQDDEPRAIPTDEEQLRRLAVADLLGVQGPVVFRESTATFGFTCAAVMKMIRIRFLGQMFKILLGCFSSFLRDWSRHADIPSAKFSLADGMAIARCLQAKGVGPDSQIS